MNTMHTNKPASGLAGRVIVCSLLTGQTAVSSQAALPLFTFDGTDNTAGWKIINDGVMGGRSDSSVSIQPNGSLVFKGNLSLENNGGFASTRSGGINADIGSFEGIELVVMGDGNTYKCGIRTDNGFNGVAHQASFNTSAEKEQRIRIPYNDFEPTRFGRKLSKDKRMNPDEIKTIGFLISDKQEGSFQLEVKSISAYRKGEHEIPSNRFDIISVAQAAGEFNTLLAAIEAAGLTDTVRTLEGVTLFAPTDTAFDKLPDGTVESLLKPGNRNQLVKILTYHVIDSEVPFSTATTLTSATALNGELLSVGVKKGALFLNDARVIENDITTGNGLIHVIDSVLLPPETAPAELSPMEQLIGSAIRRGVPLFNNGNPQACVDLYELAAEALLMLPEDHLNDHQREILTTALHRSSEQNSAIDRAWTMRVALDKAIIDSMH